MRACAYVRERVRACACVCVCECVCFPVEITIVNSSNRRKFIVDIRLLSSGQPKTSMPTFNKRHSQPSTICGANTTVLSCNTFEGPVQHALGHYFFHSRLQTPIGPFPPPPPALPPPLLPSSTIVSHLYLESSNHTKTRRRRPLPAAMSFTATAGVPG